MTPSFSLASLALIAFALVCCEAMAFAEAGPASDPPPATQPRPKPEIRVAALTTIYRHNSHADVICSRLFQTDSLDGKGTLPHMKLVSLYTDQVPKNDTSRRFAEKYGFAIYPTIADTLTFGRGELSVDAILLVAEHGEYPHNAVGNTQYPKRRFFEETLEVFQKSGRVVPVFIDKHIADNWEDINFIYTKAKEKKIPLMAGSTLPLLWRKPAADVERGAELDQIVSISYHTLDHYGFHALEFTQALAERRKGGETGIKAVRCLSKEQVWQAMEKPEYDAELFEMARKVLPRDLTGGRPLKEAVQDPTLFVIEYADGLKAYVFTLNGAAGEWSGSWKYKDGRREATWFATQEARPFYHFQLLNNEVEKMFLTGKPSYPVERTVLSSGMLDALLRSKAKGGVRVETPQLMIAYKSEWDWKQPAPPPKDRPIPEQ